MPQIRHCVLLACLLSPLFAAINPGRILDYAAPSPGPNYALASYRIWCPPMLGKLSAVLVMVPGSNSDGRTQVDDPEWRRFAEEHHLVLLACFFKDKEPLLDEAYAQAAKGSGQTLLDALSSFAKSLEMPEIAEAPLLLWGVSAGGQFNYEFATWQPQRVLAFVVNKGGFYHTVPAPEATLRVPAIMFIGERDLQRRIDAINRVFSSGRSRGALWALAIEPGVGHESQGTVPLARVFFHSVLAARKSGTACCAPAKASVLVFPEPWLASKDGKELRPASQSTALDETTNWLPDRATAEAWRDFVTRAP
ncbi:MAG: hypothetical protein WC378_05735 [Opitutaceae bacterium]